MRQRSILFLALIAAVTLASSAASAGGCGWCGGCGQAFYATGLVACDAQPFYVVNHGPVYSGPAIMTYPTYAVRAYPYVHGGCGFSPCYGVSYMRPIVHYDHYRSHHRYHYAVRKRHHYRLPLK